MDALLPIAAHGVKPGLPLDTLAALTALAIAPFVVIMTTSFAQKVRKPLDANRPVHALPKMA